LQGAAQHAADAPGGLERGVCVVRPTKARPVSESSIAVITVVSLSRLSLGVSWEAVASRKESILRAPLPARPVIGDEVRLLLGLDRISDLRPFHTV
jgi:hypothetical protein